jgi:hypothetical protein
MLHQRVQRKENTKNEYDTETGEFLEREVPVQPVDRYQTTQNIWVKIVGFSVIIMLFFGAYMDISNRSNHSQVSNKIRRKLKNEVPECVRKEESVQDYIKCLSDGVQVLIISDTDQDKEIEEKKIYEEYDMHFLHLNTLFSQATDVITFLEFFENKSPWVFVDGSYIGNEKNLSEYYEHHILDTGIENAVIQPDLNEEEVKVVQSKDLGNISHEKIDELKIRRNLRKLIPKENLSKHEILLNQYQLLQEQQKVLKEIELLNQLREEDSKVTNE